MDIDILKTFLEVNRTRHFGRAGDNLFITQSTVSARIRQLEDSVGAPLFTRARNNIQLTATGRRLLRHAEAILLTWNRAKQEAATESDSVSLTVAGMPSLWDIFLQDWLQTIWPKQTDLLLNAETSDHDTMVRRLREGTLDLAFLFDPPQIGDMQVTQIASIPLIMVSTRSQQTLSSALSREYILVEWGSSFANTHARLLRDMHSPALRMSLGRMALDFMLNCGGTAYLAEPMVSTYLEEGRFHPVLEAPVINRLAYAAYSPDNPQYQRIEELVGTFPCSTA